VCETRVVATLGYVLHPAVDILGLFALNRATHSSASALRIILYVPHCGVTHGVCENKRSSIASCPQHSITFVLATRTRPCLPPPRSPPHHTASTPYPRFFSAKNATPYDATTASAPRSAHITAPIVCLRSPVLVFGLRRTGDYTLSSYCTHEP
jgi:hypothetical protein